jgi:hypothetical protein
VLLKIFGFWPYVGNLRPLRTSIGAMAFAERCAGPVCVPQQPLFAVRRFEKRTSAASMRRLDWSTVFWFFLSQEGFLLFAFRGAFLLDGGFISDFYPHSE